jgi:Tfp pilus assembly protein PilF
LTHSVTDLVKRAAALRNAQHMEEALAAISEAAQRAPNDPRAAFGVAQISFETWRPAADLFAAAQRLAPTNPDLIRNRALALAAEGDEQAASALLTKTLAAQPGWISGHQTLAAIRVTGGESSAADHSYATACGVEASNAALWMAWFQHHAVARRWHEARQILASAQSAVGPNQSLDLAAIFVASESGDAADDDHLFDAYATLRDPGLDLCQVRHALRSGQTDRAEAVAMRHWDSPSARIFWPYLSLCWRLRGDARAQWLEGDASLVRSFDLDFDAEEQSELADFLRGLHRLKAPYPEQSVRGGTQTDRQLFFHPNPILQRAKAKIVEGVKAYIAGLPPPSPDHPLLAPPRDEFLFEGSWSVRLKDAGFHAPHTHVKGWISSAFYVAVPNEGQRGPEPAGWLALGTPPPELGLSLRPIRSIEPMAGRLVLFPSTLWHSTVPFAAGERLSLAFDVRNPGA